MKEINEAIVAVEMGCPRATIIYKNGALRITPKKVIISKGGRPNIVMDREGLNMEELARVIEYAGLVSF